MVNSIWKISKKKRKFFKQVVSVFKLKVRWLFCIKKISILEKKKKGKLNLKTRILGAIFMCLVSFQPSPFLESFSPRRGIKYGGWKISGIKLHPEDPRMGWEGLWKFINSREVTPLRVESQIFFFLLQFLSRRGSPPFICAV